MDTFTNGKEMLWLVTHYSKAEPGSHVTEIKDRASSMLCDWEAPQQSSQMGPEVGSDKQKH